MKGRATLAKWTASPNGGGKSHPNRFVKGMARPPKINEKKTTNDRFNGVLQHIKTKGSDGWITHKKNGYQHNSVKNTPTHRILSNGEANISYEKVYGLSTSTKISA